MGQRQRPRHHLGPDPRTGLIPRQVSHAPEDGVEGLLADLRHLVEADEPTDLGTLLDTIEARGHGPIILTLAGLMMLPTGMVPLMPAMIGILLLVTAIQMILGGRGVSLPNRLRQVDIGGDRLKRSIDRVDPIAKRLRRVTYPRWQILARGRISLGLIAVALLLASFMMITLGAIPGLPFVLCVPAVLFGLGMTAGDGILVALGHLATLGALYLGKELLPRAIHMLPFF